MNPFLHEQNKFKKKKTKQTNKKGKAVQEGL